MRSLGLGVSPVFRRTGGVENPLGIFGTDLTMWLEPRLDADTSTAPPDIDSMEDQGAGGHNASQATAANKPHLVSAGIADFDGTDDYMTLAAGGGGWPAHTSHSCFWLVNRRTLVALRYLKDQDTNRWIMAINGTAANKVAWFDGAWQEGVLADTGWMILEWHLDADAGTGDLLQTTSTSTSTIVSAAAWAGLPLDDTIVLCSNNIGIFPARRTDTQFASTIWVSRATGHPTGVTTEAEREKARNYLSLVAKKIGAAL